MARVLHNLLLFLIRLAQKIRVLGYWSLIYGYCALCTIVALLKLWWNIILRPTTTFQWVIRETPPACLNDTSLGTHCYVRIKVRHTHAHTHALGHERCLVSVREKAHCVYVWERECLSYMQGCSYGNCYSTFPWCRVVKKKPNRPDLWAKSRGVCLFSETFSVKPRFAGAALRWCWKNSSSASRLHMQSISGGLPASN